MRRKTIIAHTLIKNEERWIWYSINSVLPYVDKVFVYDTGSTDNTVKIVHSIKSKKIIFEEKGEVDKLGFTKLRQEMLDRTDSEWFLILDGDEIWPKKAINELIGVIITAKEDKEVVVVGQWLCVGDIFHYSAEMEKEKNPRAPKGLLGWRSIRAIKRDIGGLHCVGEYGNEGYADRNGIRISERKSKNLIFMKEKYFHTSALPRSSDTKKDREVMMRRVKTRFYKGALLPLGVKYPEVFYFKRPEIVPFPWKGLTLGEQVKGLYYRWENFLERVKSTY